MNTAGKPRQFRDLDHPGKIGSGTVTDRAPLRGQVHVVPLLFHLHSHPPRQTYRPLPGMVITVGVEPIAVKQQCRQSSQEMTDILGVLPADWPAHPSGTGPPFKTLQFHLPDQVLDGFTEQHNLPPVKRSRESSVFICATYARLAELLLPSPDADASFSPEFMDSFVKLFCAHVVHHKTTAAGGLATHRGGLSPCQRRRVLELLDTSSGSRATMAAFAAECGLSASHFARSFKLTFGLPVHRWVVAKQIDWAKSLLLHSNEPLNVIALTTGFSNQAAFNRTFAKATGVSPGRWRRYFKP